MIRKNTPEPLSLQGFVICKDCEFRLAGCPVIYRGSGPAFRQNFVLPKDEPDRVNLIQRMKCAIPGKLSAYPEFNKDLVEYCTGTFLNGFRTMRFPMIKPKGESV